MAKNRKSRVGVHDRASKYGWLAAVVVERREEYGLLQAELADLAGCSTRFIHAVETGKPAVQFDKLVGVLDTLGLHLQVDRGRSQGEAVMPSPDLLSAYDLKSQPS